MICLQFVQGTLIKNLPVPIPFIIVPDAYYILYAEIISYKSFVLKRILHDFHNGAPALAVHPVTCSEFSCFHNCTLSNLMQNLPYLNLKDPDKSQIVQ